MSETVAPYFDYAFSGNQTFRFFFCLTNKANDNYRYGGPGQVATSGCSILIMLENGPGPEIENLADRFRCPTSCTYRVIQRTAMYQNS